MSKTDGETAASPPFDLERLRLLLEAHGASPDRWPPEQRRPAEALLAGSAEARRLTAAAAGLDAALDSWPVPEPSAELFVRVLSGAPTEPARRRPSRLSRRVIALAVPLAAAAAAIVWLLPRHSLTSTVHTPIAISQLGVYTTPTDVLLQPPGFDLSRNKPVVGCSEDGLGCPLAAPPTSDQSRARSTGRVFG